MKLLLAALLAMCCLLISPSLASAWPINGTGDARVDLAAEFNYISWSQKGIGNPCPGGVTVRIRSDMPDIVSAWAWSAPTCVIDVNSYLLRSTRKLDSGTRNDKRIGRVWECTVIRHEMGHVYGLSHSDAWRFPVMNPETWQNKDCYDWVVKFFLPLP